LLDESNHPAPRLALVLGSGGVRSIAAVGIVEVLAAEGLQPDLIVGCSSGALFGATIAMGMSSREALDAATSLWSAERLRENRGERPEVSPSSAPVQSSTASSAGARSGRAVDLLSASELTQQRRWRAYAQLVAPRWFGFDAGFALLDDRYIAQRIQRAFGDRRIEDLPTPLRVVATEAASGERVVLQRGVLAQALRASLAVPVMFPSVQIDGRRLVDGVMSDPLPVGVAADAAVVLTLGFKGAMPRRVNRASRLVAQASTALINNLQQARVDAARGAGVRVLAFDLALDRPVGLWETAAMPYLFEAGRRAAKAQLAQIAALSRHRLRPTADLRSIAS
jgi:NTE family protein